MEKLKAVTMYKLLYGNNRKMQRAIEDYSSQREDRKF